MNTNQCLEPIDIENDTYVFMCCNQRTQGKACGNVQTEFYFDYLKQSIKNLRNCFKQGRIVKVNKSGCLGRCTQGPNIVIFPVNVWYRYENLQDIDEIISEHLIKGQLIKRLLIKLNYK